MSEIVKFSWSGMSPMTLELLRDILQPEKRIPSPVSIDPTGSKSDIRGAKDPLVKKFTFSTFKINLIRFSTFSKTLNCEMLSQKSPSQLF